MSPKLSTAQSTDTQNMATSETPQKLLSTVSTSIEEFESTSSEPVSIPKTDGQRPYIENTTMCGPSCSSKHLSGIVKHVLSTKTSKENGGMEHTEYLCMGAGRRPSTSQEQAGTSNVLDNMRVENVASALQLMTTSDSDQATLDDVEDTVLSDDEDYLKMNLNSGTQLLDDSPVGAYANITPPDCVNVSPAQTPPPLLPKKTIRIQRRASHMIYSGAHSDPLPMDEYGYLILEENTEVPTNSIKQRNNAKNVETNIAPLLRPAAAEHRYNDRKMHALTIEPLLSSERSSRKITVGTGTTAMVTRTAVKTTDATRAYAAAAATIRKKAVSTSTVPHNAPAITAERSYRRRQVLADVGKIMARRPLPMTPATKENMEVSKQRLPLHDSNSGRELMTDCLVIKMAPSNVIVVSGLDSHAVQPIGNPEQVARAAVVTERDVSRGAGTRRLIKCCCCRIM